MLVMTFRYNTSFVPHIRTTNITQQLMAAIKVIFNETETQKKRVESQRYKLVWSALKYSRFAGLNFVAQSVFLL